MSVISFGKYIEGHNYKVLDERTIRASAGIMLLLGIIASINGFILEQYQIIPYIAGFLVLNFLIGIFINPKFAPTMFVGYIFVRKQSSLPIGAIQKKFAWSLGLALSVAIFILSLFLLEDVKYFDPVCLLCLTCLLILFLETAFGICVGCKLYQLSIRMKLLKKPVEKPNCMGDACETKTE
ncbi:MAG: DUF4395 domain-containing protein [Bacteroidetes bacterium]|jgi:hypothetical protein|nr:DUF4395 domain-containing protein [Bacteroidota bacterium]MBT6685254.1 DUF4395 domain-containing protein [Bacteroidota bacterium]MBT7144250.1 DUF4395 domain-containing protein [Bacteroidota bacterium]MBT7490817.1 DUF4395 domain-containing protein [Bacteroidota bacterium]